MFETGQATSQGVRSWTAHLPALADGLDDRARVELIGALEELKCAAAGVQARLAAEFDTSQRSAQVQAGVRPERQGQGIASQIGLARRVSPHRAQTLLGMGKVLVAEMPCTNSALTSGRISERVALGMVQETACLALADRREVDRRVIGEGQIEGSSERQIIGAARAVAAELDPAAIAERRRRAEQERCVTLRPAPDTMTYLNALLPVKEGVAVWATLSREADRRRIEGDTRSRGQIMADELCDRVLGDRVLTESGERQEPPVTINVVVPDSVLLGDDEGIGWVQDFGPVPGDLLREWIAANAERGLDQWVRRLYASPTTGELVAMDSKSRTFPARLAEFLRLRDRECRTPYCDGRIRHLDHVVRAADGGPTEATNGQGLCEACNYAKEAIGWSVRHRAGPCGEHVVEIETPTGQAHVSRAPRWEIGDRGLRLDVFRPAA